MSVVNASLALIDTLTTNTLIVGNTTSNIIFNSNSTTLAFGSNVVINTTTIFVGNSSNQSFINSTAFVANSIAYVNTVYNVALPSNVYSYNSFTTTGWSTWTKPANVSNNDIVTIMMWGGGGGGSSGITGGGGGGGACVIVNKLAGECNAVCNVFVASGGAGGTVGSVGQTSVFWTNSTFSVSAFGGGGGNSTAGGGGGGWFSAGDTLSGGAPIGGNSSISSSTFGGATNGNSVYGGGGGRSDSSQGGLSLYGGAGGTRNGLAGTSQFGGFGGNSTVIATAPGGGGAVSSNTTAAAGARGEVRVWVMRTNPLPSYTLTANTTVVVPGQSVLYTVSTLNVPNNTTLFYTLNNSSVAISTDFTSSNGSFTVNGGTGTFTLTAINSEPTTDKQIAMDILTGDLATGFAVASNSLVSFGVPLRLLFNSSVTHNSASTRTFFGVPIGDSAAFRHIIVIISTDSNASSRYCNSVTIGGVAATIHITSASSDAGRATSEDTIIASAIISNGTTADIVLGFTGTVIDITLTVFSAYRSDNNITPTSSVKTTAGSGTQLMTITSFNTSRYYVVGATGDVDGTFTWTNATEKTDIQSPTISTINGHSQSTAGSFSFNEGVKTITATYSVTNEDKTLAAVSWS